MISYLEPDILECEDKWALGIITMNKASGGDGNSVGLFQILKDDAVKVLHSICQQIWKTQQWPQDWKKSIFIPIPKKGNAKECSNYCTIALISHASKEILKILQARLQQYVNSEIPAELFQNQKMMLLKCCTQHANKFGKLSSGHRTGKTQFFIPIRKAKPKNIQTTAQLHSSHMLAK